MSTTSQVDWKRVMRSQPSWRLGEPAKLDRLDASSPPRGSLREHSAESLRKPWLYGVRPFWLSTGPTAPSERSSPNNLVLTQNAPLVRLSWGLPLTQPP